MNPLAEQLSAVIDEHMNPLFEKRAQLQADLAHVENEIQLAESEIADKFKEILAGKGGSRKKKSSRKLKSNAKPKATDEQLLELMTLILSDQGTLDVEGLLRSAKSKLSEQGFATQGNQTAKLKKLLSEPRFSVEGGVVSLSKAIS